MMNPQKKEKLLKSATYFSVCVALIILILKSYAFIKTESVSLLASLIDSSLDITSSIINMIALRIALVPPDDNHRFGHDKVQDLAVFGQGAFFIASSIFVLVSSIMRLQSNYRISNEEVGIVVMIISIILTIALVAYQTYVLSITKSNIIKADKLHYVTDLLTNIAVIISILYSGEHWYLDPIFAIIIALYLFIGAYQLVKEAIKNLLDEEFSKEEKQKFISVLKKFKNEGKIISVHDIKTRKAGTKHFIQFHVVLDKNTNLNDAHMLVEEIEKEIGQQIPDCEIIIHPDPNDIEEEIHFREELGTK